MRIPRTLSPSAFMLWEKDPVEYALRYLVDNKPPRTPQPLPASVGSAFDAWVKSNLYSALFGPANNPKFAFTALFEQQVEEHNRDGARQMGLHCFDNYVETGSYDELLVLMKDAKEDPQFEFDANNIIDGVPLFGKPDCRFINVDDVHIILDWKVRGYCSKHGASPMKGYALCRDGFDWAERNIAKRQSVGKPSRNHNKEHAKYLSMSFNGLTINQGFLETCNEEWATQLSIYGWLMGEKVGDENVVVCIDELVGKFMGECERPLIRVANHKARVSSKFQIELFDRIRKLWDAISNGHIFQDMSRVDSDAAFEMLEKRATGMASNGSEEEDWFSQLGRPAYR